MPHKMWTALSRSFLQNKLWPTYSDMVERGVMRKERCSIVKKYKKELIGKMYF